MVSRNRTGRQDQDIEAWDADREDSSPWSEDQATTCYLPEQLHALPGAGLPPLPRRFQEARELATAQDSREFAQLEAAPEHVADGGDEWLELQTSWDASPPRASGMARRAQHTAAAPPSPRMAYAYDEPEHSAPSGSDWADELDAQLRAARALASSNGASPVEVEWQPSALVPERRHARQTRRAPTRSGAYAPSEAEWQPEPPDPHEAEVYYDDAEQDADQGPWQDEPDYHSVTPAPDAPAWRNEVYPPSPVDSSRYAVKPTAATTQRQRPHRASAETAPFHVPARQIAPAPRRRAALAGKQIITAPVPGPTTPMLPRAGHGTRPRGHPTAARSMPVQPVTAPVQLPSYALDEVSGDPFASPRRAGRSWLFAPLLACGVVAAMFFDGQAPRLFGWLQPEPAPVLRSTPLPPLTPPSQPVAPLPPPAAEPVAAAPSDMLAAAPANPARRWSTAGASARARKNQEPMDSDAPTTRRHTPQREELDSEPQTVDEPAVSMSKRAAPQPMDADAPTGGPAKLRINSRPWSQIFVDGKPVGNTPQFGLQVNAGHHTIRLVNPELDVSKTFELDARAGETLSRVELLTD